MAPSGSASGEDDGLAVRTPAAVVEVDSPRCPRHGARVRVLALERGLPSRPRRARALEETVSSEQDRQLHGHLGGGLGSPLHLVAALLQSTAARRPGHLLAVQPRPNISIVPKKLTFNQNGIELVSLRDCRR